jgi:hypothetical protein
MTESVHDLLQAAAHVQRILIQHGWRFCFIGGVAVQRWGNPRFTQDIDLTLITGFGHEEEFVDPLLEVLTPRQPDGRAFALTHRVLLARTTDGVDVDIALGALPFEDRTVDRATPWHVRDGIDSWINTLARSGAAPWIPRN